MGYNPDDNRLEPLSATEVERFNNPAAQLTGKEKLRAAWTRFELGEEVVIKGIRFTVREIGENFLSLRPLGPAENSPERTKVLPGVPV